MSEGNNPTGDDGDSSKEKDLSGYYNGNGSTALPDLQELIGRNWITIGQLSQLVGVQYRTARKYVKQKRIHATKIGGGYRIYETDLRRFLEYGNL